MLVEEPEVLLVRPNLEAVVPVVPVVESVYSPNENVISSSPEYSTLNEPSLLAVTVKPLQLN